MKASSHRIIRLSLAIILASSLAAAAGPAALARRAGGPSPTQLSAYTHDESIVLRNELRAGEQETAGQSVLQPSAYTHDESIVLRNELRRQAGSPAARPVALPQGASIVPTVRSDGFSWGDFGIGAAGMLGLVGAVGAGAVSLRHRTRRAAA